MMSTSKLRMLLVILAGVIITVGMSGCMSEKAKEPTAEEIKMEVEKHLQEKYGEEFEPLSFTDSNWAYSYNKMYWYPKNGEESDNFEVRVVINKDGSRHISDGYFGRIIAPEYAKVVSEIVRNIYEDFKFSIRFREGMFLDRLNKDTKLEDIYNKDEKPFVSYSTIFVKEDSAKGIDTIDSLKEIANKLIEKKLVGNVKIYIVKNEKFDSITMEALNAVDMSEYFVNEDYNIVVVGSELEVTELR